MRGSFGCNTIPQQEQPQSQMPSQAYANYAMSPAETSSFSIRVEPPTNSLCCMLSVIMFPFCF